MKRLLLGEDKRGERPTEPSTRPRRPEALHRPARGVVAAPRQGEPLFLLKALISLALDYLRWTQLVPMLFGWTILLLMVGALLLISFEDASSALIERGIDVYERLAGPVTPATGTPSDGPSGAGEDEAAASKEIHITDEDIMPWVLRGWALLALVAWLIDMLRSGRSGPREPTRLGPKLRIAAYCAAGCSAGMWIAYLLGTGTFDDGPAGWALVFVGVPLGVWLVSAWSLTIGHVIGIVQRHLDG